METLLGEAMNMKTIMVELYAIDAGVSLPIDVKSTLGRGQRSPRCDSANRGTRRRPGSWQTSPAWIGSSQGRSAKDRRQISRSFHQAVHASKAAHMTGRRQIAP